MVDNVRLACSGIRFQRSETYVGLIQTLVTFLVDCGGAL